MIKIQIIVGSTRENRAGKKVADWVVNNITPQKEVDFELVDLKDYPLPFYEDNLPPKAIKGNYSSPVAKKWVEKIKEADGYIFITPEYNHGPSAVLKNALDYPYFEWNYKAATFVSYGGQVGGSRAVEQLRLNLIELQMAPIRDAVHIPYIWNAFDEKGVLKDESEHKKLLDIAIEQLIWWTKALKNARSAQ